MIIDGGNGVLKVEMILSSEADDSDDASVIVRKMHFAKSVRKQKTDQSGKRDRIICDCFFLFTVMLVISDCCCRALCERERERERFYSKA